MARTCEELDVEDVHALVLPWRGVLATTGASPTQVEDRKRVPQHGVKGAGEKNSILDRDAR